MFPEAASSPLGSWGVGGLSAPHLFRWRSAVFPGHSERSTAVRSKVHTCWYAIEIVLAKTVFMMSAHNKFLIYYILDISVHIYLMSRLWHALKEFQVCNC